MSINNKIAKIREVLCNGDNKLFAETLGFSVQYASNICKEGKNVGDKQRQHILNVFPAINRSWFLADEGEMLNTPKNPFSQMTEREIETAITEANVEGLMSLLKKGEIYLASTHDKIVAGKDEEIARKDKRIEELLLEIGGLQNKLPDNK